MLNKTDISGGTNRQAGAYDSWVTNASGLATASRLPMRLNCYLVGGSKASDLEIIGGIERIADRNLDFALDFIYS